MSGQLESVVRVPVGKVVCTNTPPGNVIMVVGVKL